MEMLDQNLVDLAQVQTFQRLLIFGESRQNAVLEQRFFEKYKKDEDYVQLNFSNFYLILFFNACWNSKTYLQSREGHYSFKIHADTSSLPHFVHNILVNQCHAELDLNINSVQRVNELLQLISQKKKERKTQKIKKSVQKQVNQEREQEMDIQIDQAELQIEQNDQQDYQSADFAENPRIKQYQQQQQQQQANLQHKADLNFEDEIQISKKLCLEKDSVIQNQSAVIKVQQQNLLAEKQKIENQNQDLENYKQKLQIQNEDMQNYKQQIESQRTQIESQSLEIQSCQAESQVQKSEANAHRQEIDKLKMEMLNSEAQIQKLNSHVQVLTNDVRILQEALIKKSADKNQTINQQCTQIIKIQIEREEIQKQKNEVIQMKDQQLKQSEDTISKAQNQLSTLRSDLDFRNFVLEHVVKILPDCDNTWAERLFGCANQNLATEKREQMQAVNKFLHGLKKQQKLTPRKSQTPVKDERLGQQKIQQQQQKQNNNKKKKAQEQNK